jgi:hypothetical protein
MGVFSWQPDESHFTVGSTGIGGQSIASWIRVPAALVNDPTIRRLYIACSPIGLAPPEPLYSHAPFPNEGADVLAPLGIASISHSRQGALGPEPLGIMEVAGDILSLRIKGEKYNQIQTTLLDLRRSDKIGNDHQPRRLKAEDLVSASRDLASLWKESRDNPTQPANVTNGSDSDFKWEQRGIIAGLSPGGETDRVLGHLIEIAKSKGIEVILYETPTLKHFPGIYPPSFFSRYQATLSELSVRHGVKYIDLSGLLPEDGRTMSDFCHTQIAVRPIILKALIAREENVPFE